MDDKALIAWREGHGWSQPQAARALGVPLPTYRNWEQHRRATSRLLPLATAYLDEHARITRERIGCT